MPDIYDQAEEYKRALLKRERAAAVRLVNAYGLAWARLSKQLKLITKQIREAREKGEIVNQSWLYRQERYIKLLDQVSRELVRFAEVAEITITREQRAAVKAGLRDSQALMSAAVQDAGISASFNRVNFSAVENLVGFLGNGSPLNTLLGELPRKGRAIVEKGLIDGVTLGHNPKKIAREIRQGLAGSLNRALLISRTEVARTYRTASLQTYKANSDLGGEWQWVASKSSRTCAACIALDGQRFPLSKPLPAHPACRCTSIFVLDDSPPPPRETGAEWFAKQPADAQRAILGSDRAYQAFKDGEVTLQDFVGRKDSMLWGQSYHRLSAKRAIAGEGRFPHEATPQPAPVALGNLGEFKTVAEAERWAKAKYQHIDFDFAGTDINVMNPVLKQFDMLATEWPEVAQRMKFLTTYQKAGKAGTYFKEDAYAHARMTGEGIGLNAKWFGDADKIKKQLRTDVEKGWHPPGTDSPEAVLTHEFGHLVDGWLQSQNSVAFSRGVSVDGAGVISDTSRRWQEQNKATPKLSRYAMTQKVEAWAEGFAAIYHTPKKQWPQFVKNQVKFIDGLKDLPRYQSGEWEFLSHAAWEDRERLRDELDAALKKIGVKR